jgi:uncharacterized protein involved in outer membrane biogenesis
LNPNYKKFLTSKPLKVLVGVVSFYLIFAYFGVNPLAQRLLPWVAEKQLNSRMTVGQVKFDPFALTVTVDNLDLTRADGMPLAGFKRLYLDLETKGILDFAWRFKDIQLIAPKVNLDIAKNGQLNWADLIAKLNENPKENSEMTRVMIDHLLIEAGNVQYSEHNREQPFTTVLKPLGLALDGLSTLPKDRGDYTISAKLPEQGAIMRWKGELSLNPITSKGVVDVQGLKVAKLMQLINLKSLPISINSGDLETRFSYQFAMTDAQPQPYPQAKITNLVLTLAKLGGTLNTQTKLNLDNAEIRLPNLDFSMQHDAQVTFKDLSFAAKAISIKQNDTSLFNLQQADISGVDYNLAESQLKVANVLLVAGEVSASRAKDGELNWQQLMSNAQQDVDDKSSSAAEAVAKPAKTFNFDVAQVQLQHWKAQFNDQTFKSPIKADIKDIDIAFNINNADGNVGVHQLNTSFDNIAITSALYPQPLATLNKVSLKDGDVSLKDSLVSVSGVLLSGLNTEVLREANQTFNWQVALEQSAIPDSTAKNGAEPNRWKVALATIAIEKANVHFEDKTTPAPMKLDVDNAMLAIRDASLDLTKAIPLKVKLPVKQGGLLNIDGKIAISPLKGDFQVKLDALSLKPYSPYVNQFALLKLEDGQVNLKGKLSVRNDKKFSSRFSGGFSINNLAMLEEDSGTPFLAWKEVASDDLSFDIAPNQLHMASLRISDPVGKFIIFEDKSLNVKRILRAKEDGSTAVQTTEAVTTDADFPINVERININNGELEFADLSLTPQFGTHINSLSGVISGLSSDATSTAQVELDGKVDDYGSARIRGSVQPFKATDFTDLKLAFHNLEMNRLTPYSGKFAGRKIESGKLSVDLEYKIKQRKLEGENKFIINKIILGERVESPDAANLPLDLAIALLEDSDGVIDLDLPIKGSLDDPQFSYGKVVWKAFVNVLGKIVTAPFRLLGKLFGGDSDKLGTITFDSGSADISPEQQEKLNSLAAALKKRPTLLLTISPTYDGAADKVALQVLATRIAVLKEMEVDLKSGERPGPIDLNNVKAQIAIDNLLKDRKGEARGMKAIESIKNAFRKSKPEDLPIYQKKLEELKNTTPVSELDLTKLAQSRADSLKTYLTDSTNLDVTRLSIGELSKASGNGKVVEVKLSLGVAKH